MLHFGALLLSTVFLLCQFLSYKKTMLNCFHWIIYCILDHVIHFSEMSGSVRGWVTNAVMRVVCQIGKDATWFNIINSSFLKLQFFQIIHKYKERDSWNGAVKSEEVKMHRLHPGMPSFNCMSVLHNSEEDIHTSNRGTMCCAYIIEKTLMTLSLGRNIARILNGINP